MSVELLLSVERAAIEVAFSGRSTVDLTVDDIKAVQYSPVVDMALANIESRPLRSKVRRDFMSTCELLMRVNYLPLSVASQSLEASVKLAWDVNRRELLRRVELYILGPEFLRLIKSFSGPLTSSRLLELLERLQSASGRSGRELTAKDVMRDYFRLTTGISFWLAEEKIALNNDTITGNKMLSLDDRILLSAMIDRGKSSKMVRAAGIKTVFQWERFDVVDGG